jgi:hypothetical protein
VYRYERGREDGYSSPYTCYVELVFFSFLFFPSQVLDLHMEEMILDGSLSRIWSLSPWGKRVFITYVKGTFSSRTSRYLAHRSRQTPTLARALSHIHHKTHSHALRTHFHTYLTHRDKHVVRQHDKGFACPPSDRPRSLHTGICVCVHYASMFDSACVFLPLCSKLMCICCVCERERARERESERDKESCHGA